MAELLQGYGRCSRHTHRRSQRPTYNPGDLEAVFGTLLYLVFQAVLRRSKTASWKVSWGMIYVCLGTANGYDLLQYIESFAGD